MHNIPVKTISII